VVEKGGVAQRLRTLHLLGVNGPDTGANTKDRNILTLDGNNVRPFKFSTSSVSSKFTSDEVNWIRGQANVTSGLGQEEFIGSDLSGNSLTSTGVRHSIHGDVLHSRPVALNYGRASVNDEARVVVFYGSNDGHFRAVDGRKTAATAGNELWSMIMPEHYPMFSRLRAGEDLLMLPETNSAGQKLGLSTGRQPKDYAMDGPVGVYARYVNGQIGSNVADSEAFIFPAMRRGGRSVYALNVTNPESPSVLWSGAKIQGGSGDYAALAQTWSLPRPVVFSATGTKTPNFILLMGGGYDPAEEDEANPGSSTPASASRIGNRVYVINGRTGARLREMTTDFSVPSDITVVDTDFNGEPDRAYVADVRGNLYRIDFPIINAATGEGDWSRVEAVKIASLGGKVFYPPDVVVTRSFVAVLVGTGDREKPLMTASQDYFYLVKDNLGAPRSTALTRSDLTRVARVDANGVMQDKNTAVNDAEGCYLELSPGEKVVNAPASIAGVTYFGTNTPNVTQVPGQCSAANNAFNYEFPLFCGVPKDPTKIPDGGMPPSPQVGIVEIMFNGQPTKVSVVIGKGDSPFKAAEPKPTVSPVRKKTSYRVENNGR
jgi:type IV pilus assembly protein PilY1